MRRFIVIPAVLLLTISALVWAQPAAADPSIGSDAALPVVGAAANTVLEPLAGTPMFGPAPPPPATVLGSLLAPPAPPLFGEVEDISYGDEMPLAGPLTVEFSTALGFGGPTTGHPGAPPPPPPAFDVRTEAGVFPPPPPGDGATASDIYSSMPLAGPPPCGPIGMNVQSLDGDGAPGAPFGPPRLALNMPEPGSNVDAYERLDSGAVDAIAPFGVPDAPVFFTIDAATAAAWPVFPLPPIPAPGGGVAFPGPNDILAYNPLVGGPVIWATGVGLGLLPGDNIDALAVSYFGIPLPPVGPGWNFAPGDIIVFSLSPGSPSLSPTSGGVSATALAPMCTPPGTGTAGDLWFVTVPVPVGGAIAYLDAEMLGLNTVRTGGGFDDNVDAIDMCNGLVGLDWDADLIDNTCDYDDDGDGIGDLIDPDDDGDGFMDVQSTSHQGPANTDPTVDNCPNLPNMLQLNADGNFVDNSPPYVVGVDDKTWANSDFLGDECDTDDDNDGLLDTTEGAPPCGTATGATSPLLRDTDGDRVMDGAECVMGSDPFDPLSKPAIPPLILDPDGDRLTTVFEATLGTNPALADTDGDGAQDGWEYKGYNSNPLVTETDGDVTKDGCEIASINGDKVVNPGDQALLSSEILRVPPPPKLANFDLNKDGAINPGDQAFQSFMAIPGKCPP